MDVIAFVRMVMIQSMIAILFFPIKETVFFSGKLSLFTSFASVRISFTVNIRIEPTMANGTANTNAIIVHPAFVEPIPAISCGMSTFAKMEKIIINAPWN